MVSKLFQLFNSIRGQIGILDWGIKMSTLEDGEDVCVCACVHVLTSELFQEPASVYVADVTMAAC